MTDYSKIQLKLPHLFFFTCASATALIALFFVGFLVYTALPVFQSQGIINFITGTEWNYSKEVYGIGTFIYGTALVTIVTLFIAVPLSLFTAIFLAEYASENVARKVRPMIELLVGIPSVIYGIFGLYVLENIYQDYVNHFLSSTLGFLPLFENVNPNTGSGVLLASTVLSIMILPTVTAISEDSLRSVSRHYREASFAMGATHWETIRRVVLPVASKGILAAITLGTMRAMGETMAIVMLLGTSQRMPSSLLETGYAMTSKILTDIGFYVADEGPRSALFGIAVVLFAIEMVFVGIARSLGGRK
ncbi:phosphate ABC transporter permease subunit PstC [Methanolobus bombayensis]|uniref:phosphate ABC transporter permease subunit PstC n=1 Tax=Methanolobus bombayensis TaxID=38023 RepID=UPI001AE526B0|nr:phosphate ABC transporter permease subunit PstC [Methanolobus bombayensis]MBP1909146.1 phosphate transport system permease protein [Methanolobus bombayensis]